jgi:hypothetical protein
MRQEERKMAVKTVRITAAGAMPDEVRLKHNQDEVEWENQTLEDCEIHFTRGPNPNKRSPFNRENIPVPASGRENSGRQQGTSPNERYDYEVVFKRVGQKNLVIDPTVIIDR